MKKFFTLLAVSLISGAAFSQNTGYQITVHLPGYTSGIAYLAYYMGKNLNAADSGAVSNKGVVVFKGKEKLPGGIYSIVYPGKGASADFLIDKDQNLTLNADSSNLTRVDMKGSKDNLSFMAYKRYVDLVGKEMMDERALYSSSKTKADSALHEAKFVKLNTRLNEFRDSIINAQPNSIMGVLLAAMKESPLPPKKAITHQDSIDNYHYYKAHYWDGITFMDDRIVRTPFFLPKLEKYYQEVIIQQPDTIIADLDYKLLLARTAPEMYKFLLNWATDEYISPKYMGLDAVFVHLFNKYHSKGLSPWLNDKQMETITRRAYMQMANLIGEKAADLNMVDSTNKPVSLYSVKAPYTVVIFWDPTCGHCKEELPHIDSLYKASWKAKGVKVYAVLTEDQKPAWVKYIKEHKLGDWINVYQTKEMADAVAKTEQPSFRQLYDVIMTPTMYLLDNDKRIIGKKLTWKQLNDLLEVKIASKQNHTKK
ncbi:MAG: redoxin domain-containing protein [Chitinophagaceae bacterium]|nr:redoxin domain-containing protein [Bacteroidota bacterium]MCC6258622.1 redoxin domain-containing protein [Chitinophagaceae bacterium]